MPFSTRHHDESNLRPTHSDTHPDLRGTLWRATPLQFT